MMFGFSHSMRVANSSTLLLMLWKLILTRVSSSSLRLGGGVFVAGFGEDDRRPCGKGGGLVGLVKLHVSSVLGSDE